MQGTIDELRARYRQQQLQQVNDAAPLPELGRLLELQRVLSGASDAAQCTGAGLGQSRLPAVKAPCGPPAQRLYAPPATEEFLAQLPVYVQPGRPAAAPAHQRKRWVQARSEARLSDSKPAAAPSAVELLPQQVAQPTVIAAQPDIVATGPNLLAKRRRWHSAAGTRVVHLDSDLLNPDIGTVRARPPAAIITPAPKHACEAAGHADSSMGDGGAPATAILDPKDDLLSTRRRAPTASFAPPTYGPTAGCAKRALSPGRSSGSTGSSYGQPHSPAAGCGDEAHPQLNPDYKAVMPAVPAASFPKAPRFVGEPKPLPGAPQDNAARAAAQHALDVAAAKNAILPRATAAWFSKAPRFQEPGQKGASVAGMMEDEDPEDTWQQPRRFKPGWLAPKAAPGSTDIRGAGTEGGKDEAAAAMARPDKPKVKTAGVEAALDFVKQRTAAAPSFGGVSVKEQIQKELARRLEVQKQRLQEEQLKVDKKKQEQEEQQQQRLFGLAGPDYEEAGKGDTAAASTAAGGHRSGAAFSSPDRMPARKLWVQQEEEEEVHQPAAELGGRAGHSEHTSSPGAHPSDEAWGGGVRYSMEGYGSKPRLPLHIAAALIRSQSAQPERPITPSFEFVHKRVPSVAFGMAAARASGVFDGRASSAGRGAHGFSDEPGPGAYEVADDWLLRSTLSTASRAPAVPFTAAARVLHEVAPWQVPPAEALQRMREADLGAAFDRMLRARAPAAFLNTAGPWRGDPGGRPDVTIQVEGEEGSSGEGEAGQPLDVSYTLVEARVRGAPIMRPPQPPRAPTDREVAIEAAAADGLALQLAANPWEVDRAVRSRHPAWMILTEGRDGLLDKDGRRVVGPQRPQALTVLFPNWEALKPRVRGIPDFARFLNTRIPTVQQRLAALHTPAVGDYDIGAAWTFVQKHVPAVVMHIAAERWKCSVQESLVLGGDQAVLELAAAMDYMRPRPRAALILPEQAHHSRVPLPAARRGFGPMLSLELEQALDYVKRRGAAGLVAFEKQAARDDPQADAKATAHLAPGGYDVRYTVVEVRAPKFDFGRGEGHGILTDSSSSSQDGEGSEDELPLGARLQLDVVAAKDHTLRRPPALVDMGAMTGREEPNRCEGDVYGTYTREIPLPDPDLDLVLDKRPRVQQVVMGGAGREDAPPSPDSARRGPGMYDVAHIGATGTWGPAPDFSKAQGHPDLTTSPGRPQIAEGDRLDLSPNVDAIRARAPAALVLPEHVPRLRHSGEVPDDLYRDADYGYDLNKVRPGPRAPPDFERQLGRSPPGSPSPGRPAPDYHVEDVPLSVLAGYPGVRGVPNFARMQPHAALFPGREQLEGERLDLDDHAAFEFTRPRVAGVLRMEDHPGHADPTGNGQGPDPELTAWLSYNPKFDLVKPAPAAAPDMGRVPSRAAAVKADPRTGEPATDDLDGGVYNVRHTAVWASPRAAGFGMGPGRESGQGKDVDEGNVLMLEPQSPKGWQPVVHSEHTKQPMGVAPERWQVPGPAPDDGNVLLLRTSADDMGQQQKATLPNAPVAVFGAMTASRYEVVVKPNENLPIRQVQTLASKQTMETTLMMQPPSNKVLELIRKDPTNPMVAQLRRRDRVWGRVLRRLEVEHPQAAYERERAAADAAAEQENQPLPHAPPSPAAGPVGRADLKSKQARAPKGPRERADLAQIRAEEEEAYRRAKTPERVQRVVHNFGGMFYAPPGPGAPPAVPGPYHENRGGFFQQAIGRGPLQPVQQGAPVAAPSAASPGAQKGGHQAGKPQEQQKQRQPPEQVKNLQQQQQQQDLQPVDLSQPGWTPRFENGRVRHVSYAQLGGAPPSPAPPQPTCSPVLDAKQARAARLQLQIPEAGPVAAGVRGASPERAQRADLPSEMQHGRAGEGWGTAYEGNPSAPTHMQEVAAAKRTVSAGKARVRQRKRMAAAP